MWILAFRHISAFISRHKWQSALVQCSFGKHSSDIVATSLHLVEPIFNAANETMNMSHETQPKVRHVQELLGLKLAKTSTKGVVFISIDFEAYEHDHRKIAEVG